MRKAIEERDDHLDLVAIEGEQLSAVTFVQDYVQLHFDGPLITAVTLPTVMAGTERYQFGDPGYRDGLCSFIAKVVVRAYVRPHDRLQIDFSEVDAIVISLKAEDYDGPEAAIFHDDKTTEWEVW